MTDGSVGPAASGVRVPYDALPPALHAWVDAQLGSRVVAGVTQPGGFSPGVAARLQCADGTRAFVKAVSAEVNAESCAIHRREAEVLALLPRDLPVPRLLAAYDEDPWAALLLEDADGVSPALPWQPGELDRVLRLAEEVNAATGIPLGPIGDRLAEWGGWTAVASGDAGGPDGLDDWSRRHLDRLVALEQAAPDAAGGDRLVHLDLRADNVVLGSARAWLVDWPWAGVGARWVDVVTAAPCVQMQGGPAAEDLLARSGTAAPADGTAVTAVVAALAGLFVHRSRLPAPPGLPTLRAFQAAQATITLAWLQERTGWR